MNQGDPADLAPKRFGELNGKRMGVNNPSVRRYFAFFSFDRRTLGVDEILLVFREQTVFGQKDLFGQSEQGKGAKLTLTTDSTRTCTWIQMNG